MSATIGMGGFIGWVFQTTWQAAVIAGMILLAQFLLRRRLSAGWRHGLWFLLVARLLMPIAPSSGVSVFNLAKWPRPRATPKVSASSARADFPAPLANPQADGVGVQAVAAHEAEAKRSFVAATRPQSARTTQKGRDESGFLRGPQAEPIPQAGLAQPRPAGQERAAALPSAEPRDWMGLAAAAWLAGVLVLSVRLIWLDQRFRRRLSSYVPVPDERVGQLLRECAESLGVNKRPRVIETEEVESPAVYGLWCKRLLLPDGLRESLSPEELRHVLLHELAHIKRRDAELNWLMGVLQIVHWFNPVLWFAFARMRGDRELATDELALSRRPQGERSSYGETVLKVLDQLTQPRAVLPGLVGIGEGKAQIKERIRAIARGGTGPRGPWAACAVAMLIAGLALTNAREERQAKGINLLEKYPTKLTAGDAVPGRARPWQFTAEDIFQVTRFSLEVGKKFRVETGVSDLGIGHCADGAVWGVLIPREEGKLTSPAEAGQETIAHVWLRFHPAEIGGIFPADTVSGAGSTDLEEQMRGIAGAKFHSSWHAGNNAMIPEPKDMTVDVDTTGGPRRFFMVDKEAQTAEYAAGFAGQGVPAAAQPAEEPEVDTNCARVVAVAPANGAKAVEAATELRIRFDRPMNPYHVKLEWQAGGFQLNGGIQVAADHKEFIIPVRLTPGQQHKLVLNHDQGREMWVRSGRRPELKQQLMSRPRDGFVDAHGVAANEFRWSFSTKPAASKDGAGKPRVVSATPALGATTPVLTLVEVAFDRPMRPPEGMFPYVESKQMMQGPSLLPGFDYDSTAHRFTFPALLRPDDDVRLTVKGFYSEEGVASDPVVLHYQTSTESLDARQVERAKAAAKDAGLQKLLTSMKEARARLNSGVETVQTIDLQVGKNSFTSIGAQTATFKWQGQDQVCADISGPMLMSAAFILGCDGQTCWLYSEDDKGEKRLEQTPAAEAEKQVALLDPFGLADRSVEEALGEAELVRASDAILEGRRCHRLEKWDVRQEHFVFATLTQWWIDEETLLPRQIVQYHPNGCQIVRFDFQDLNQHLADSAFQPPVAAGGGAKPLFFKQEPQPDEQRFLRISDGSNGRMSGRIGWHGPNGTTSSGLN